MTAVDGAFSPSLPGLEPGGEGTVATIVLADWLPLSMNEREGYFTARMRPPYKELSGMVFGEKKKVLGWLREAKERDDIPEATGRRRVQLTFQKTMRGNADDPGNLYSRTKALLDALVKLNLLVDDSDQWLDLPRPLQVKGPQKATIITIGEELSA